MPRGCSPAGLTAALCFAALWLAGPAGADPGACEPGAGNDGVVVHLMRTGATVWCSPAVIEAQSDVPAGTDYQVQQTPGQPQDEPVTNGISVGKLLTLAGAGPESVSFTAVPRADGSWSTLSHDDLRQPPPFENGLAPVVFIDGSAQTQYLRPLRGPDDTNGADQITAGDGTPLDLYAYGGRLLSVTASAAPSSTAPNQAVTFTASVADPPPGATLTYTWKFGDGAVVVGGPQVRHAFAADGSYEVLMTVGGDDGSGGAAPPITEHVGTVPAGGAPGPGAGGSTGPAAPLLGPVRSEGNTSGARPGRAPLGRAPGGAAASHRSPGASGTTGTVTNVGGTSRAGLAVGGSAAQGRPSAAGVSSGVQVATYSASGTRPVSRAPRRSATRAARRPAPAGGEQRVAGLLLSGLVPVAASELAGAGARNAAPAARLSGGSDVLTALGAGVAALAVAAAGAGAELRGRRRWVAAAR